MIRPATAGSSQAQSSSPLCGRGAGDCVIDGDTFRFRGEKIRIADIDAPETGGAKCADEAALGQRATLRLAELLSSRPFRLEAIGSRDVDSYGRKLRIVANGGGSIGAQLVDEGLTMEWRPTPLVLISARDPSATFGTSAQGARSRRPSRSRWMPGEADTVTEILGRTG